MLHWARPIIRNATRTRLVDSFRRQEHHRESASCESAHATEVTVAARIDGRQIAQEIKQEIAQRVNIMNSRLQLVPGLAMLQVGHCPQSDSYVSNVRTACTEVGIRSFAVQFPASATEGEILQAVNKLNADSNVHGIIVQMPLPKQIRPECVLREICIDKDVDGLHPTNLGKLAHVAGQPTFIPCTPRGCLELLMRQNVQMEAKSVVVIGCSNVVGLPTALLLQRHNATVTIVDKYTQNHAEITRKADILISATGNANLVRGHWIKPGAVVIDVGMNIVKDPNWDDGFRFLGDVCFEEAQKVASAITPVPGGVGPMTVAMLLSNTLHAADRTARQ